MIPSMADLATLRTAVQRWVERAEADPRVKACWLEGASPRAIRTFDGPVDLHVGVEDPDFGDFVDELEAFLGAGAPVRQYADGPAPPDGWATVATLDGVGAVTCTLERMSLVAKRPRVAVQPLFDRSGHLRHVLDYSAARRAAPRAPAAGGLMEPPPVPSPTSTTPPKPPRTPRLDDAAVAAGLGRLPDWHREGNELLASYEMPSFLSGVTLVGQVALAAERAKHHPDILVRWRTVSFSLSSHDAGGITQRDLDLAGAIAAMAERVRAGGRTPVKATKPAKRAPKKKAAKPAKRAARRRK